MGAKIWIYVTDSNAFDGTIRGGKLVEIEKDNPKLNWAYKYSPAGKVQYTPRKNSKNWQYVDYGDTRAACLEKVNQYTVEKIAELKRNITEWENVLVKDENA